MAYFDKEILMMRKTTALFLAIAIVLSLAGCASKAEPAEVPAADNAEAIVTFTDSLGRDVSVYSADRVAILIGSFVDVFILAGGRDRIVAAANDSWTNFDLDLSDEIVNTGSVKDPELEAILGAEPDFIIASSNTSADVDLKDTFENAGITVAYFDVENFDDYLSMLDICTTITGCRDNYEKYGLEVQQQVENARAMVDGSAPKVLYVRASGSSCKAKGSEGNLLGEMLADLGCVNIADTDNSILDNLSLEKIMEDDPYYIFVVLQGADPTDAQELLESTLLDNPAWQTLSAVQEGRFYMMENNLYNLKPNADWGTAYEKLATILYGEKDI